MMSTRGLSYLRLSSINPNPQTLNLALSLAVINVVAWVWSGHGRRVGSCRWCAAWARQLRPLRISQNLIRDLNPNSKKSLA